MKRINIPVVVEVAGRTLADSDGGWPQIPEFPGVTGGFVMPEVPLTGDALHMAAATRALERFQQALTVYRWGERVHPQSSVMHLDPETQSILDQALGEGEVSATLRCEGEVSIRESVFSGVWRVRHYGGGGRLERDYLEGGPIPEVLYRAMAHGHDDIEIPEPPAGAMNAPLVLREVREQARAWHPGQGTHVVNLSSLPVTPVDRAFLDACLGTGPVQILSGGFGECRITSTQLAHVWRVQYLNGSGGLILDTIEVTEVPEAGLAARDDLADSIVRLAELVSWMQQRRSVPER